jgi:hypothetical protein
MIRIDSIWLATEPMDMRAGTDTRGHGLLQYSVRRSRTVLICLPIVAPRASKCWCTTGWVFGWRPAACIKASFSGRALDTALTWN